MPDELWLDVRLPATTWRAVAAWAGASSSPGGEAADLYRAIERALEREPTEEDPTTFMDLPTPAPADGEFPDLEPWRPTAAPPYDHERPQAMTVEAGRERYQRASDHPVVDLGPRHVHVEDPPEGMPEALAAAGFRVTDRPRRPVGLPEVVEAVDHLRVVLGEWLDIIERDA